MKDLRLLWPHFKPYRRQLTGGIACILAGSVAGLLMPLIIGWAIDSLNDGVSVRTLVNYGLVLVGATAVRGLFQFSQRYILVSMSRSIERDLRQTFFRHLQTLEPGYFAAQRTGDLMARATNDLEAVRQLSGPAIMYGSNTIFTALGCLVFMLDIHPGLTLLALGTLPLVAWVTRFFGQKIHTLFQGVQEQFSGITAQVQENISGARVVRAYVQEDAERATFAVANDDYVERNRRLILWDSAFRPLLQGLVGLGFAAVLGYGGVLILRGAITVGEFVTFQLFLGRLVWPMIAIGWVINLLQRAAASMGRIEKVLVTRPTIRDGDVETREEAPTLKGALAFRGLSYSYRGDDVWALRDVDLEVAAGEKVALVGRTGSGKSTLLSMVPRLLEPPPGTLEVDGVEVHGLPLSGLRAGIAVVPQETFLFSASLRDNIAFSRLDADEVAVHRAVRLAGLDGDVAGFPEGLETLVGERGLTLSGGQKQR
ncbi:MAG: ABC transporter ATP-binding protein, partial [Acidobacteriota bacterium]